jgi:hypothetical protein
MDSNSVVRPVVAQIIAERFSAERLTPDPKRALTLEEVMAESRAHRPAVVKTARLPGQSKNHGANNHGKGQSKKARKLAKASRRTNRK